MNFKKVILFLLIINISSCSNDVQYVKINEYYNNSVAEKELNEISKILNGYTLESEGFHKENNKIVKHHLSKVFDVYFKFDKNQQLFYFQEIQVVNRDWKNEDTRKIYTVPVKELDPNNIEYSNYKNHQAIGDKNTSAFEINSKYNNYEAFKYQFITKSDNVTGTTNSFTIYLKPKDAEKLKKALINFLKNI